MHPNLVLVQDPRELGFLDLERLLSGRGPGKLSAVVEAAGEASGTLPSETAGAPIPVTRYRLRGAGKRNGSTAEDLDAAAAVERIVAQVPPPFAVVALVSFATLPLLEALHADSRTRDFFKWGITGVQLDTNYNLARKLYFDGKIHYHEHTLSLHKVIRKRLVSMIEAHAERAVAPPAPPHEASVPETPPVPETAAQPLSKDGA